MQLSTVRGCVDISPHPSSLGILVVQIQLVKYLFYILVQGAGTHNVYPWIVFLDTIKVEGQRHELASETE